MALPIRKPGNGSGGFLNGESATIKSATYVENKKGKTKKGNDYTSFSVKIVVARDGADAVDQFLNAGFLYDGHRFSKDKKTIEGDGNYFINADTDYGQFATTLFEKGDNESRNVLPEDAIGDGRSLSFLEGLRVTFRRQIDRDATIAAGARKLGLKAKTATEQELFEAGKKKNKKDNKSYALDKLTVSDVLGYTSQAKTASKPAAAAATTAPTDTAAADAAMRGVLAANGGELLRSKLSATFLRYASNQGMTTEVREPLRKTIISEGYQADAASRDVIAVDGDGKDAKIILVPVEEEAAA